MKSALRGVWAAVGLGKNEMLSDVEGWEVASALDVQFFLFKKKKMDLCKKSSFWLWRPTVNPSFNDNEVYW